MSIRIHGHVFNRINDAARQNKRPLGSEIEYRLERSFEERNMTGNAVTTRNTPLSPSSFAEAVKFSEMMATSTMVPPDYRGKPANILLALQYGAELGLSPLQSVQSLAVINGKPSVYGDALLAIVRASPLCEDVIERTEGDGDAVTAICEARRRGSAPVIARFSVSDARKAGLWGKSGPWSQYPQRMLQHRARGFAIRDAFPDLLRGVISVEEAGDIPVRGMVDVTPPPSPEPLADDLDAFAAEPAEPPAATPDERIAEAVAQRGSIEFRDWWQVISRERRDALRPHLGRYQTMATAADAEIARNEIHEPGRAPPETTSDGPPATSRRRGRPPGPRQPSDEVEENNEEQASPPPAGP